MEVGEEPVAVRRLWGRIGGGGGRGMHVRESEWRQHLAARPQAQVGQNRMPMAQCTPAPVRTSPTCAVPPASPTCTGRLQKRSTTKGVPGTSCHCRMGSTWAALQADRWAGSQASGTSCQERRTSANSSPMACEAIKTKAGEPGMSTVHSPPTRLGPQRLPPPAPPLAAATALCAHCCAAGLPPRPRPGPAPWPAAACLAALPARLLPSAAFR